MSSRAFLLPVLFLTLALGSTRAQSPNSDPPSVFFFENGYIISTILPGGYLEIEGFENPARGRLDLPHRRITLVFPGDVNPSLSLRVIRTGPALPAHPFWGRAYAREADSSLTPFIVNRFTERQHASGLNGTLFHVSRSYRNGSTRIECSVPVVLWDEEKGQSRVVETFQIEKGEELRVKREEISSASPFTLHSSPFTYLKLFVRTDGLYRMDRTWFSDRGIDPSSIPLSTLRLQAKGKDLPWGNRGLDDGSFDSGDFLYFVGQRNYDDPDYRTAVSGDEEMKRYLDKYGDSTAVLVSWGGDPGARAGVAPTPPSPATDTLRWFLDLARAETNANFNFVSSDVVRQQISDWTSEDTWYNGNVSQTNKANYALTLPDLFPGLEGRAWAKFLSWSTFAVDRPWHRVGLSLNGSAVLDSTEYDRDTQTVFSVPLAPSSLKEGANTLTAHNLLSVRNTIAVAFAEIDFPRRLRAASNRLLVPVRDPRMTGFRLLAASGFTDTTTAVLRLRDGALDLLSRSWIRDTTWTCLVSDTVKLGDLYVFSLLSSSTSAAVPTRVTRARLEEPGNAADYLLVTTRTFEPAASEYAAFVASSYNVLVKTVYVEDVYEDFSFGMFRPEAIKSLFQTATSSWSTRPRFALLLGDANYNYKAVTAPYSQNFVPSFGYPVGDGWYAQLQPGSDEPLLALGRIPARSQADIREYLRRHQEYLAAPFDEWNKRAMLFSGGKGTSEAELAELRLNNEDLRGSVFGAAPWGGLSHHFYKTLSPQTDFGPVTGSEFQRILAEGALCISYLGHSGTMTWDNSIGAPSQIANAVNRYALITDFGCSTGKFAEPDITCFAELFTLDKTGQAIAYVGNSALGFTSLTQVFPKLFYAALIRDSVSTLGEAHRLMKSRLLAQYGASVVNQTGLRSNTLFGDPILRLALPPKPNLVLRPQWSWFAAPNLTDRDDSVRFGLVYANLGRVRPDSLRLTVEDRTADSLLSRLVIARALPLNFDTLFLAFPIKALSGSRLLRVALDPAGEVDEISDNDNNGDFPYTVASGGLQVLNVRPSAVSSLPDSLIILNPVARPASASTVHVSFADNPSFANAQTLSAPYGVLTTRLRALPSWPRGTTVYWKADLDDRPEYRVGPFTSRVTATPLAWLQADTSAFRASTLEGTVLGANGVTLGSRPVSIRAISSGYYDGNFAVIEKDGINLLPNSFGYQYSVVVLDSATLDVKRKRQYVTWQKAAQAESLSVYLKAVTFGEIPVITTSDEPLDSNNPARPVMRTLGSKYIDSLKGWSSWAMIGRVSARPGTVPEGFRLRGAGRVTVDTSFLRTAEKGRVLSPPIGPAATWNAALLEADLPPGSSLSLTVLGIRADAGVDTLFTQPYSGGPLSLSTIDATRYRTLRLAANLALTPGGPAPILRSWGVDYQPLPELALNYQTVTLPSDTVSQGSTLDLSVRVSNVGPSPAGPFSLLIEMVDQDNQRSTVGSFPVTGLASDASESRTVPVVVPAKPGALSLVVTADPGNAVAEQFENNNSFTLALRVRGDTVRPTFDVLVDGAPVMDGDFVRPTPEIRMRIYDEGSAPIPGLGNFLLYLNDTLVTKPGNALVTFLPGSGTEKASILFTPTLDEGQHVFRVNAVDEAGNKAQAVDQVLRVWVESRSSFVNLMNFPNPFAEQTAFTFALTGVRPPDRLDIRIYTMAGRLIREIQPAPGTVRIGFNSIPWDGKDADGDRVANGLYFYKVTAVTGSEKTTETGKLSVAR